MILHPPGPGKNPKPINIARANWLHEHDRLSIDFDQALAAVSNGWSIFPCRPGSKDPATAHGCKDASNDPEQVRQWWTWQPTANIGIACGPSRLIVIDLDVSETKDGLERWEILTDWHGHVQTYQVNTPSGGCHFYYQLPEGWEPVGCSTSKLAPGIDVRGVGGYVIGAGSVRADGEAYTHAGDFFAVAPCPKWLHDMLTAKPTSKPSGPPPIRPVHGDDPLGRFALDNDLAAIRNAPEGTRNDTLNRAAFHQSQLNYWGRALPDARERIEQAGHGCGLEPSEVARTVGSGWDAGQSDPGTEPDPRWGSSDTAADLRHLAVVPVADDGDQAEHLDPHHGWGIVDRMAPRPDPPPALVAGFWPAGASITIAGAGGSCKSYLALNIAAHLALGREILGTPAAPPKTVLYIDLEMDANELDQRLEAFGITNEQLPADRFIYSNPIVSYAMDADDGAVALLSLVEAYGIEVVVFDTMSKIVAGPENDNDTYQALHRKTQIPLKHRGVSVCWLDHVGHLNTGAGKKSGQARGASAKSQNVDVPMILTATGGEGEKRLTLTKLKNRFPGVGPVKTVLQERNDNGRSWFETQADDDEPLAVRMAAETILELCHGDLPKAARLTNKAAKALLREHDRGLANVTIAAALRELKARHKTQPAAVAAEPIPGLDDQQSDTKPPETRLEASEHENDRKVPLAVPGTRQPNEYELEPF